MGSLSPNTRSAYTSALAEFFEWLGRERGEVISPEFVTSVDIEQAFATATDVNIDLATIKGVVKSYWFNDLLTTKVTTTRNIIDTDSALSKLYLNINSKKFEDAIGFLAENSKGLKTNSKE